MVPAGPFSRGLGELFCFFLCRRLSLPLRPYNRPLLLLSDFRLLSSSASGSFRLRLCHGPYSCIVRVGVPVNFCVSRRTVFPGSLDARVFVRFLSPQAWTVIRVSLAAFSPTFHAPPLSEPRLFPLVDRRHLFLKTLTPGCLD